MFNQYYSENILNLSSYNVSCVSFLTALGFFFFFQALSVKATLPMNYYTVFHHISQLLPDDCIVVSEGANTMDIGRTMLNNYLARHRQGGHLKIHILWIFDENSSNA